MSWSGVKRQVNKAEIEAWCDEMRIKNYTINPKGEIDVDGNVSLGERNFKELPYKFGQIEGFFEVDRCPHLISLKNSPNYVRGYFSCSGCKNLDSLEGCPKKIGLTFFCNSCKRPFEIEEIQKFSNINVNRII